MEKKRAPPPPPPAMTCEEKCAFVLEWRRGEERKNIPTVVLHLRSHSSEGHWKKRRKRRRGGGRKWCGLLGMDLYLLDERGRLLASRARDERCVCSFEILRWGPLFMKEKKEKYFLETREGRAKYACIVVQCVARGRNVNHIFWCHISEGLPRIVITVGPRYTVLANWSGKQITNVDVVLIVTLLHFSAVNGYGH